jgi:hypothetical protein
VVTSTLDGGWVLYELPEEGFSVALPPTWMPVNVDTEGFSAMMDAYGDQNPQLGGFMGAGAMSELVADALVFNAVDTDPAVLDRAMPPMLNVLAIETGIALPLDMVVPLTTGQLEEFASPDAPITSERIDVDGVQAEVIRYVGDLSRADGEPLAVDFTQVLIPVGGRLYVLSLSAPVGLGEDYGGLLNDIVAGFGLLD